jgi:hypothetical protein
MNKFLIGAALIAIAVFATTSIISTAPLVGEKAHTTDFQGANPELRVAQRYADMTAKPTSVLWVANPELNAANRFTKVISSVSYSANPELLVAGRYGTRVFNVLTSSFLTTNPEIMTHLRYTAAN